MKRLVLFAAFDKDGVVDDYVVHYVKALSEFAQVIYVADNEMKAGELEKLSPFVLKAFAAHHGEYDFGSYKRAFAYAKECGLLAECDELILCNDSVYLAQNSLAKLVEKFSEAAVWGAFKHEATKDFSQHLQSWFLALKKEAFSRPEFERFLLGVTKQPDKQSVILNYEVGLSALLCSLGFELNALADSSAFYPHENLPVFAAEALLSRLDFPFLKTSVLKHQLIGVSEFHDTIRNIKCDKTLVLNHFVRVAGDTQFVATKLPKFSIGLGSVQLFSRYTPQRKYRVLLCVGDRHRKLFSFSFKIPAFLYEDLVSLTKRILQN